MTTIKKSLLTCFKQLFVTTFAIVMQNINLHHHHFTLVARSR